MLHNHRIIHVHSFLNKNYFAVLIVEIAVQDYNPIMAMFADNLSHMKDQLGHWYCGQWLFEFYVPV